VFGLQESLHRPKDLGVTRVGWLLLLAPIAALLLVAPTLGSYGVGRAAAVDITAGAPVFERLQPDGSPATMTLLEFGQRAFERNGASFNEGTGQADGVRGRCGAGWVPARSLSDRVLRGRCRPRRDPRRRGPRPSVTPIATPDEPYE
jgi:hypothetical protein